MRKITSFIIAIVAITLLFSTAVSAQAQTEISCEAAEQTILRLLFQPAHDAIEDYYGKSRQYMNDKILQIKKVPNTPYYEVVIQVETFYGPHNPPYGIETMTFYVSYGEVQLKHFDHKDDPV